MTDPPGRAGKARRMASPLLIPGSCGGDSLPLLRERLHQTMPPALGGPRLVDWVDYVEDIEAVGSDAFAEAVLQRAGTGDIWLVWSEEYRGVEDRCEEVIALLTARRPARTVIRESGEQFEHGWLERFAAP